jgi:hypothetical protein
MANPQQRTWRRLVESGAQKHYLLGSTGRLTCGVTNRFVNNDVPPVGRGSHCFHTANVALSSELYLFSRVNHSGDTGWQ